VEENIEEVEVMIQSMSDY